jgi:hypothetical protein
MPKFFDELGEASLENLASDPSNLPEGRVWKNSTSQLPKIAIGGAVKELLTNDGTQVVTGKTLSGASNTITNVSGSNVTNTPSGNLAATDVQAALNELQSDIDTRATSSALTSHTGATSAHGVTGDLVGTTDTQVITNKDIDGGTAANTRRITIPKDTLANLQALTRKEGTIVYATDTGKFYADNGTSLVPVGSGSGAKNYFTDGDAEGSNPFTLFNDGVGIWVDGTGGSPTATITQSATNPLSGQKSFLFTSGTQYDTGKASITIDREDKYKIQVLEVSYELSSGTYADGDLQLFVFDSANSAILYASPVSNLYASGTNAKQQFAFQASDSLTYQILIHQKTSATFAMKFEMKFGPQFQAGYAPITTDPVEFDTSAGVWIDAVTTAPTYGTITRNEGRVSQNGSMRYYTWQFEQSDNTGAAAGSGNYLIKLPYKMDLTKYGLAQNFTDTGFTLDCAVDGNMVSNYNGGDYSILGNLYIYDEQTLYAVIRTQSGTYNLWSASFGQFSSAGVISHTMWINVHTLGQSAESKVVSEYDGRVVSCVVKGDPASASSGNPIIFPTVHADTHSAYNATTGEFTAPYTGHYRIGGPLSSADSSVLVSAYVDGVDTLPIGVTDSDGQTTVNGTVFLEVNQILTIRPNATMDVNGDSSLSIELLSGSQQISAGERIYADYSTNAGQSIPNTTATIVDFEDKTEDSHGSVTTGGSFKFTAKRNDIYTVSACTQASAANYSNIDLELRLYKNGTFYRSLGKFNRESTGATIDPTVCGTLKLKLNVDDYVDVRAYQANGASINLSTASEYNWFQVTSGVV